MRRAKPSLHFTLRILLKRRRQRRLERVDRAPLLLVAAHAAFLAAGDGHAINQCRADLL